MRQRERNVGPGGSPNVVFKATSRGVNPGRVKSELNSLLARNGLII